MNDNENIAKVLVGLLEKGTSCVLATLITMDGSGPRHSGSKMVIDSLGNSFGTVGGSLLEATVIKESGAVITSGCSRFMDFYLDGKDSNARGMICGGKTQLFLDFIPATVENQEFFKKWGETVLSGRDFYFLTHLQGAGQDEGTAGHTILFKDKFCFSSCQLTQPEVEGLKNEAKLTSNVSIFNINENQVIIDPIRKFKTLYCFGAGHVAVPTAHLAALVGFRVVVIDDRPEFACAARFPDASQVRVITDFDRAMEGLELDSDSYVVIVTRGHRFDRVVLEQAIKTKAGYIGMISSRRKREVIYSALIAQGVSQEVLAKVYSPIGIPIGGETPEEIAVSIVAELIKTRVEQQG
ncbi:MAG TPA: XdhC/CoxI family protein [Dehalococcoidales bacterium]|nr:XdhC/CoxI family protein [Dehalococcoidales bacterium]